MNNNKSRKGSLLRRLFRRAFLFKKDDDGATAVEFALIALPFVGFVFLILEGAVVFWAEQVLEDAVARTGRLIRTGQAQTSSMTSSQFKAAVCDEAKYIIPNCLTKLHLNVDRYPTFSSVNFDPPVDADGNVDPAQLNYQPGIGGDIIIVQAFYEWPMIFYWPGSSTNWSNGNQLLTGATAFRNEPF